MNLSPNFTLAELRCRCGCETPEHIVQALIVTALHICEPIREAVGRPVHIVSGYRCEKHNEAVGGATASQHPHGRAIDAIVKGMTAAQVRAAVRKAGLIQTATKPRKIRGVGKYGGFSHFDRRPLEAGKPATEWAG